MAERPLFDKLEDEYLRGVHTATGWFTGHHDAAPAATDPKENTMALSTSDLRSLADELDKIGTEGLNKTTAILANPATAEAFDLLHLLTGMNIHPAQIGQALGGLRALQMAYAPVAAGAEQAAAPANA